jgi:hypothetical protein
LVTRTDRDGAIAVDIGGGPSVAWTSERLRRARYWRDRAAD